MVKLIFIFIIAFAFFISEPSSATIHELQVNVNLDQVTLKEGIEVLNQIFGKKIVVFCNTTKFPQNRFSVNLEQATLEQSIKELMRKSKVQNHALFLDHDKKNFLVWILSAEERKITGIKVRKIMFSEKENDPLASEQMLLLAQYSIGPEKVDDKPLTPKQIEQLQEQSFRIEEKIEESIKPLTTEQIYQLQDQKIWMEGEKEEDQDPLSAEQIEELQKHHIEIEPKNESGLQTLSKKQLLLLKEQGY